MVEFRSEINSAKRNLADQLTRRKVKQDDLTTAGERLTEQETLLLDTEKAREVVQKVSANIQQDLEYQISNMVTLALSSVFEDPMEFKTKFVERRNQTELDLFFVRNDVEYDPMDDGGGAKDIASIALRMAIWSICKTRALMILDEPSRNVSHDMQGKVSEMIKMLSTELGIQMIIVSHIDSMVEAADKVINVVKENGISRVTVI